MTIETIYTKCISLQGLGCSYCMHAFRRVRKIAKSDH